MFGTQTIGRLRIRDRRLVATIATIVVLLVVIFVAARDDAPLELSASETSVAAIGDETSPPAPSPTTSTPINVFEHPLRVSSTTAAPTTTTAPTTVAPAIEPTSRPRTSPTTTTTTSAPAPPPVPASQPRLLTAEDHRAGDPILVSNHPDHPCPAGSTVTVDLETVDPTFALDQGQTTADANGAWSLPIEPFAIGSSPGLTSAAEAEAVLLDATCESDGSSYDQLRVPLSGLTSAPVLTANYNDGDHTVSAHIDQCLGIGSFYLYVSETQPPNHDYSPDVLTWTPVARDNNTATIVVPDNVNPETDRMWLRFECAPSYDTTTSIWNSKFVQVTVS